MSHILCTSNYNKNNNVCKHDEISKYGQTLYKNNRVLRDIATVMEHPEFKSFFDKYFKSAFDAQNIILLMKIYNSIPNDDPYEKIAILFEAMNESKIRNKLIDNFIHWRDMMFNNKKRKKMIS